MTTAPHCSPTMPGSSRCNSAEGLATVANGNSAAVDQRTSEPCGSASTASTRAPASCSACATCAALVVLPVPPLRLSTATVVGMAGHGTGGTDSLRHVGAERRVPTVSRSGAENLRGGLCGVMPPCYSLSRQRGSPVAQAGSTLDLLTYGGDMNTVKAGQRVRRGRDEGVVCQVVRRHRQDG